jgi:hypothetical protein
VPSVTHRAGPGSAAALLDGQLAAARRGRASEFRVEPTAHLRFAKDAWVSSCARAWAKLTAAPPFVHEHNSEPTRDPDAHASLGNASKRLLGWAGAPRPGRLHRPGIARYVYGAFSGCYRRATLRRALEAAYKRGLCVSRRCELALPPAPPWPGYAGFPSGYTLDVGSDSCPVCAQVVPPLGWIPPKKATNGQTGGTHAGHLPIESRTCPACHTRLERTPPGDWQSAPLPRRSEQKSRQRFSRRP